jgi:hypothetical protein
LTPGEKAAAGAAAERIRERLGLAAGKENFIEWKFSIPDIWSRQLFIALCRRYGLRPFRNTRMHRQTVMIKGPKSFIEQTLWPEFQELNAALEAYLSRSRRKSFARKYTAKPAMPRKLTSRRGSGDDNGTSSRGHPGHDNNKTVVTAHSNLPAHRRTSSVQPRPKTRQRSDRLHA